MNCPNTCSNQCEQDAHHNSGKCDTVHRSADSSGVPMHIPPTDFRGEGNLTASPSSSKVLSVLAKVKKGLRKSGSAKAVNDRCKSTASVLQRGRNRVMGVNPSDGTTTLKEGSRKRKRDGKSPVKKRRKLNNSEDEVYSCVTIKKLTHYFNSSLYYNL